MSQLSSPSSLFGDLAVEVFADAPIGPTTWYGIGGRADFLVKPLTVNALSSLMKRCRRSEIPIRVLGNGANLLVADEGVDGIVVRLDDAGFREFKYNPSGELNALKVMAGADLAKTLMDSTKRGLAGLEHLAGVPASIGGAIWMNAGGKYGCIGDSIRSVTCLTSAGEIVSYDKRELRFSYRKTNIPDPVILSAVFEMEPSDPIALRTRVKEIFEFKKSTQPLADHSAGCAFRNPIDPAKEERVSAGKLIDDSGLKGESIGGAMVSKQHANFITTEPGATATDVRRLLDLVRERVFAHCGIELETEVVIWQRDMDDKT